MPPDALINVLTAAVAVSAVALLLQTLILFGLFRAIRGLRAEVAAFVPKAEAFLSSTEKSLAESRQQIQEVTAKAGIVLDSTQKQLVRVDDVLGDATTRVKAQMERVELVLDDLVTRIHKTMVELNEGILRPLREINGVVIGLRVGIQHLLRGGRPNVAQATADEEMFI
jgi:ABC-type transporter Mla subunit MlaD